MSRGHRNSKLNRLGERYGFRISNLKAVQVPKSWDRLFVSLVSVETGKAITKTGRAFVRNGSCQWLEVMSDSLWLSRDDPSQGTEDCNLKLVVSMGSARSEFLGEATLDIAGYAKQQLGTCAVSLPLKKCNHGTMLQLNLQCPTPRAKNRDNNMLSKATSSKEQGSSAHSTDIDSGSDKLEDVVARIIASSSKNGSVSQESSFSTSDSYLAHSCGSVESSLVMDDFSQWDKRIAKDLSSNIAKSSSLEGTDHINEHILMLEEMDKLKKECLDHLKNQVNLAMELAAANAERDGLRNDVEQLKVLLEKLPEQEVDLEGKKLKERIEFQKQYMDDEIKLEREANADLSLQLKKIQNENAKLLYAITEKQEEIEQQQVEIKKLLKQAKKEKAQNMEQDVEAEYNSKLLAKEREIVTFREKLSKSLRNKNEQDFDLMTEIRELKEKIEDLERDCDELTNENLELLIHIKETNNSFNPEVTNERFQIHHFEEKLRKKVMREIEEDHSYHARGPEGFKIEMEAKVKELMDELSQKRIEAHELEANMESKESENEELRGEQMELEARILELQKQKDHMEENIETMVKESDIASKCVDDLRKELMVLSSSLDSHVSTNGNLEKKSLDLENEKCELEMELTEVSNENKNLLKQVSSLESQIRDLKEESDSTRLLLENSKSYSTSLEDEITRYANDVESQKREMDEELQDMHNRLFESQKELERLTTENSEMLDFSEAISADYNSLQKLNEELKRENSELSDRCTELADSTERTRTLQEALSSVEETSSARIQTLMLEQEATSDKCSKLEEMLKLKESSWNQMYLEKTTEVVKLHKEVQNLSDQLANECHERDNTMYEISCLHADKVNLESALKEAESRVDLIVSEMIVIKTEAEAKIEDLIGEINTFSVQQEKQRKDHEKVLKLLEHYKVEEEKLKTTINDLELKLTVFEYEQKRLSEKSKEKNVDLLRMEDTEEEIRVLRIQLDSSKSDKQNLEASLTQMSKQKQSLKETICTLQNKLQKMQIDLEMRDSLFVTNRQFHQKIQQLEQERGELVKRSKSLEEKLSKIAEEKKQLKREDANGNHYKRQQGDRSLEGAQVDFVSKIKFLESELAKATEASNMYKNCFNRLSKIQENSPKKQATIEVETMTKERFEHIKSALEIELKDIQERYYQMSLRYAEVEEQREELIMKLKESKNDKKLF